MDMEINFPNLGIYLDHVGKNISIFGFSIAYYGIVIVTGMMIAIWIAQREAKRTGQNPEQYLDLAMIGIAAGILGARIYYVIFAWDYYKDDLLSIFNIRQGGLAIYGGIIGACIAVVIYSRKKKQNFSLLMDTASMSIVFGQIMGRWGNFFNREAFGDYTNNLFAMQLPVSAVRANEITQKMWDHVVTVNGVEYIQVHPTFLYESIWCFVGFLLLFRYIKKRKFNGDIALRYMIWYGAGRFWIEALRTDSLMLVPSIGLRASQLVAGIAVVVGVAAEIYFTHKFKDKPLMVKLAMTADNKAAINKLSKGKTVIGLMTDTDTELLASSPRKLFVERTEAYNAEVKRTIAESGKAKQ